MDMAEHDRFLAKSPHPLERFDLKARKELVVRGLLALSEVRDADFYFLKGEEQRMRGNLDMAISYYEKALEIDPEHENSLFNRGLCYAFHLEKYGEYDKAIADFSKVIEMNPRHARAYYYRGITLFVSAAGRNEINQAISDYTKAIEIIPRRDSASAYYHRGHAYYVMGEHDKAVADHNNSIKINPRYVRAYTTRGSIYAHKGDYDKAISDYTMAIDIDPSYVSAYTFRGHAYEHRRKYDLAISDYTMAIELNTRRFSAPAYLYLGIAHYLNNAPAIEFLTSTIADRYFDRGGAYYWKGEYDKAWEDVHKTQSLGHPIPPSFLKALREASGRAR